MGSKKAFISKSGKPIVTDDNSKAKKQWANAVATAAAEAMNGDRLLTQPVKLTVAFFFSRPKGHFGTGRNAGRLKNSAPDFHAQTPDLDKLYRCLGDALTGIVIQDDKQICRADCFRDWTLTQERAEVEIEILN